MEGYFETVGDFEIAVGNKADKIQLSEKGKKKIVTKLFRKMKMKIDVVCPNCGKEQKYLSYRKSIKNKRRKRCIRCGRSFLVTEQRKSKVKNSKKDKSKPKGFFKYSKEGKE